MKIKFVAFDSFSTRSMATFIEVGNIKIFIDPSISIAPKRYNLNPHPLELKALEIGREKIKRYLDNVDIVIITHYHWDHCPHPKQKDLIEKLKEKKIIIKNPNEKINNSQRIRAKMVLKEIRDSEVIVGDSKEFDIENVFIKISEPVWHGKEGTKLGWVIMPYIEYKGKSLLFASDIQGPISSKTVEIIIELNPKILVISGPPTYLLDFKFSSNDLNLVKRNLEKIICNTNLELLVIDHHLLRDINWKEKIGEIFDLALDFGVEIKTAAEYEGRENIQLEARRKELWKSS